MAGSTGTLVPPDPALIHDPDELYRQLMQLVGRDLGQDDWGSAIVHTSWNSISTYAHTVRNRNTPGGGLHFQALHSATGAQIVGILDDGLHLAGSTTPFLVGSIVNYAGSGTPTGWLLCDGSAVSRSTYSALFAAIGTTWGAGNGSTTFNVPDIRQRFQLGAGGSYSLGATGGVTSHSHGPGSLSLGHRHAHSHGAGSLQADGTSETEEGGTSYDEDESGNGHTNRDGHVHELHDIPINGSTDPDSQDITSTTSSSGSTDPDTNFPSYAVVRPLIFAGV